MAQRWANGYDPTTLTALKLQSQDRRGTQIHISAETRTQAHHSIQFAGLMWYLSTENQTENYRITRTLIESNDDDDDDDESYQR